MQRDNQGRELVRSKTAMRLAFERAMEEAPVPLSPVGEMVALAFIRNTKAGLGKAPAWRISRRGR